MAIAQETTLPKVIQAVTQGILLPEDYEEAITATGDPAVEEYLRGLMPEPTALTPVETFYKERAEDKQKVSPAVEEYRSKTLTLEDINSSVTLRRMGALAGDRHEDNKLIRVFSNKEDSVDSGEVLTEENIRGSDRLQELQARAGDRIVEGKLRRSDHDNNWVQFKYGWDEDQGLIANAADWLESRMPIGEVKFDFHVNSFKDIVALPLNMASYTPADELYGEGFSEAEPAVRREMIIDAKERKLQEGYGQFFDPNADSGYRTAGNLAAQVADVSSLAPMGQSYKAMSLIGAGLGAATSVSEDAVSRSGKVDLKKAAISGVFGGALAPATGLAVNKIGSALANKGANKLLVKAQKALDDHFEVGGTTDDLEVVLSASGLNPLAVQAAVKTTGRKLNLNSGDSSAEKAVVEMTTKDSATSRLYSKKLDKYLGILSTRIGNISETVKGAVTKFEYNIAVKTAAVSKTAEPFLVAMKALDPKLKVRIGKSLSNSDFKTAVSLMRSVNPELATEFIDVVQPMLKTVGENLRKAGHTFEELDNYFPRLVKDYDALSLSMGKEKKGIISEALDQYARKKGVGTNKLTNDERSQVIDLTLRGYRQTTDGWKLSNVKQRQIEFLTDDQMQYYAAPEEALAMYLRSSINDIEKRKFFGRTTVFDKAGGFDADQSIGAMVKKAMDDGEVSIDDENTLKELLASRFVAGEQQMSNFMSINRDLGYMGTIANPASALIQLADVGIASAMKGFRNSIGSMFGAKDLKLTDIGLGELIAKDIAQGDPRATAKLLSKLMKGTGFQKIDRLGKETFINAAFKKAQQMVKSPKGEAAFRKKIGKIYGEETDALIADLKTGEITENVKLFAFTELSGVQPISLSEMPQGYLDYPDGRILYMLKSFTLKQYDIVRKEVIQEWNKGSKIQAVKNAGLLAGYITATQTGVGTAKDMLLGRDVKPEDVPDKAMWALIGVFGINEYTYDNFIKEGDLLPAAISIITPATPIIDAALTLTMELPKDDPQIAGTLRAVPAVGPLVYNWFGGGAEKTNKRREDKRRDKRMGN